MLGVDIGNTRVSLGLFRDKVLQTTWSVPTAGLTAGDSRLLRRVLSGVEEMVEGPTAVVVSSVVPALTGVVEREAREILGLKAFVVGRDKCVPITNHYRDPDQVGADRLLAAYAAKILYGTPVVVVDLGTALTLDVVSPEGAYEGGMIVPGLRLALESLHRHTALLPLVEEIHPPEALIGKDTCESILSGLFWGYGAMVTGLLERIGEQYADAKLKVVLTGGHTRIMRSFISWPVDAEEEHLVLRGLGLI